MASEIRTLCDIFLSAAASGKPNLLLSKVGGAWRGISASDFGFTVRALSLGLNSLGIQPGDRVAILSENRPEWAMADYAIQCAGAWSVPIYPTLPAGQIAALLKDCSARAIFVSTAEQLAKIQSIRAQCPALEYVVTTETGAPAEAGYLTFHQIVDKGRPTLEMSPGVFEQRAARVKPEDVATIIYTSGTTGEPKGAMLTHSNFVSNVAACLSVVPITGEGTALSFLPLSHVFERMIDYSYLYRHASVAYAESIDKLKDNLLEVNPHCFAAVPRVYEKVHARIFERVEKGSGLKKKLFFWAIRVGRERLAFEERGQPVPAGLARRARIADRLVFSKIRHALGSRFRFAVSGGAPLSRELAEFFLGAGVTIYEGYGLTETSPVIAVNGPKAWRLGTVGRPIPGVEAKIAEDGEILTRGPHVMKGYYKKPEATAEVIDKDGWFHTGDIGQLDRDGFLVITDRKKDILVTSGGKNIAPQPIENRLKANKLIAEVVMIGNKRHFPAALVVPSFEQLEQWARQKGLSFTSREDLIAKPEVVALYEGAIRDASAELAQFEKIKKISLLPKEFSLEAGELTPTLKVKRRVVEQKYKELIDRMYEGGAAA